MTDLISAAAALRARLQAQGAVTVIVEYDGYSDSGYVEHIGVHDKDGAPIASAEEAEIADLFYEILGRRFDGWENDEGACGVFTWDLRTNELVHEHRVRYEAYNEHTVSGWAGLGGEAESAEAREEAP
ncbi:DUF6878 family protein [Nitrospira calida]|jgi:hypothetical protein